MQNERFYILINLVVVRRDDKLESVVVIVVMLRCHYYWVVRALKTSSNSPAHADGDNSPAMEEQSADVRGRSHETGPKGPSAGGSVERDWTEWSIGENMKPVTG